jgi:chemotaxis protein MotB
MGLVHKHIVKGEDMQSNMRQRPILAALFACSALFASCASSQYRAALDEKDADNKELREERANLKGEVRDVNAQKDSLETALAEANARLLETPQKTAGEDHPELDKVGVGYGMRDGRLVISVPSEISFPSGKAELSKDGQKALAAVAKLLKDKHAGDEYWIEGHTDSDPIVKSKYSSNRELSLARAMAVLHYFVDDANVADGKCVIAGWGPYRPVAPNDTKANKAKNRRVEIIVETPKH